MPCSLRTVCIRAIVVYDDSHVDKVPYQVCLFDVQTQLVRYFSQLFLAHFYRSKLQWANKASLDLLSSLVNRVVTDYEGGNNSMNRTLFIAAYRAENIVEDLKLKNLIREFRSMDTVNTTQISLQGFQLESLNEMVSEALCLPQRKTKSLSKIIHLKTQGFPESQNLRTDDAHRHAHQSGAQNLAQSPFY